jgi:hypothetical protein
LSNALASDGERLANFFQSVLTAVFETLLRALRPTSLKSILPSCHGIKVHPSGLVGFECSDPILEQHTAGCSVWSATLSATWKAAENDCLERRNSIRPCVPSHVAYKAERGGNELFWSPWKMYPRSQERRRNREATVYLPALGGDGPRLDRTIRIYKCSQASSAEESLKCCAALLAVSTEA